MLAYKNSLYTAFLFIILSVLFQGCLADKKKDVKLDKAEERRLVKQKLHTKHEQDYPIMSKLARNSGYMGYVEYKSIEKFISAYEFGRIDINDYTNYIISNTARGTYAYKFFKLVNDIEIYEPDSKYGWLHTVGIKRDKGETGKIGVGTPMKNTKIVSFLGMSTYKTIYGVYKKILVFDRAPKFKVASVKK